MALIALTLLAAAGMHAQQRPEHVQWTTEVDYDGNGKGVIRWIAEIEDGWHIYGMTMPAVGEDAVTPQLTTFTIDPAPGLTLDGEIQADTEAKIHFDESLKLKLPWWEGRVTFTQPFTLDKGTSGAVVRGKITYMACTDKACTAPARVPFDITIGDPAPVTDTEASAAASVPETAQHPGARE